MSRNVEKDGRGSCTCRDKVLITEVRSPHLDALRWYMGGNVQVEALFSSSVILLSPFLVREAPSLKLQYMFVYNVDFLLLRGFIDFVILLSSF